ncbi:MAG: MoaD/ThiS family protein [Deltaproteobacteria bacterium]|nr:MoaD/ThiS family protein [Deltaproteobacteria bacterium]
MSVRLLFFSVLRDKMKRSEGEYDLREGENVLEVARRALEPAMGPLDWGKFLLFAVGDSYVSRDYLPKHGDEIALIPPVAGG